MNLFLHIINIIHLLLIFVPVFIFFIPINYIKSIFKYIFLLYILVPLQWDLADVCILTKYTQDRGGLPETTMNSAFSEVYLKWFYYPIMKILGCKWNDENLEKAVTIHWIINIILLWVYLFYFGKKKLI